MSDENPAPQSGKRLPDRIIEDVLEKLDAQLERVSLQLQFFWKLYRAKSHDYFSREDAGANLPNDLQLFVDRLHDLSGRLSDAKRYAYNAKNLFLDNQETQLPIKSTNPDHVMFVQKIRKMLAEDAHQGTVMLLRELILPKDTSDTLQVVDGQYIQQMATSAVSLGGLSLADEQEIDRMQHDIRNGYQALIGSLSTLELAIKWKLRDEQKQPGGSPSP